MPVAADTVLVVAVFWMEHGNSELEERRMQTAKGEFMRFLEAVRKTSDQHVKRTFKGLLGSLHSVFFDEN